MKVYMGRHMPARGKDGKWIVPSNERAKMFAYEAGPEQALFFCRLYTLPFRPFTCRLTISGYRAAKFQRR